MSHPHVETISHALEAAVDAGRAAGADDVEVSYAGTMTEFVRFASSRFTQVGSTYSEAVRIRVLIDGRMGSTMSASLDHDELATGARDAVAVAKLSPPIGIELEFAREHRDDPAHRMPALAPELTATGAPDKLAAAFEPHRANQVGFAGALKSNLTSYAVLTAGGCHRTRVVADADAQMIALAGGASGYAGSLGHGDRAPDFAQLAATAADRALRGRDPIDLEPGAYDVVLAPEAIAELIEWMAMVSFGANALIDGTSLLAGRQGAKLCGDNITLRDRTAPGDLPFDSEGTSRAEVTFIDRGLGGQVVTDRVTAARLGDPRGSTGHASRIVDESATGPTPAHLVLEPGDATDAELIGRVKRGLYLTRLHYVNGLLNPRKATTTGMTRDGTFLIEDGQLTRGVANLRFTEHMLEALGRVDGLGADAVDVPTWWSDGGLITVPAVLIRDFHFTGRSR